MNLVEFVNKYNGLKVDYDKNYGAQCVDLFRQYCRDVFEIPHTGGVEGAKDLYLRYEELPLEKKYFSQVGIDSAKPGDVVVWGASGTNRYGHVAILLGKLDCDLIVFEQDGFLQDGAKIMLRKTDGVLGCLRRKS